MVRENKSKGKKEIALLEIFTSIDGEAFHSGQPTVFVRTFGCNLRCSWCDTSECFDEEHFKKVYPNEELMWMTADEIFTKVLEMEKNWTYKSICLTGGEPLVEENKEFMTELISKFCDKGFAVNIETNGSIDYSYWRNKFPLPQEIDMYGNRCGVTLITDWKLPSSKMSKLMNWDNITKVLTHWDIIKCVISDDPADWEEFERICKSGTRAKIFVSPCFGQVTMKRIPEFVIAHPEYNITAQIQAHKVFWDPKAKHV